MSILWKVFKKNQHYFQQYKYNFLQKRIISKEKKNLNAEILEDQYSQLLGELTLFR